MSVSGAMPGPRVPDQVNRSGLVASFPDLSGDGANAPTLNMGSVGHFGPCDVCQAPSTMSAWLTALALAAAVCSATAQTWPSPYVVLTSDATEKGFEIDATGSTTELTMPEVSEGVTQGFLVGHYTMEDFADVSFAYVCREQPSNLLIAPIFSTPAGTNELVLETPKDYETLPIGVTHIQCQFNTLDPCNSDRCKTFNVFVLNLNDHAPVFGTFDSTPISIDENDLPTTPLRTFVGRDPDGLGPVTFSLTDNTGPFEMERVDDTTFNLILTEALDFEQQRSYILNVQLEDTADSMGITQSALNVLYVSVVDQGDTPPTWLSFPTMASSEEMAPVGEHLFTISARDGDTGINNAIQYSIKSIQNGGVAIEEPFLSVNSTGSVSFSRQVDREEFSSGIFVVTFEALEQGSCDVGGGEPCTNDQATTSFQLLDINDNEPIIDVTAAITTIEINENFAGVINFGDIIVTDDDADVIYSTFQLTLEADEEFLPFLSVQPSQGLQSARVYLSVSGNYLDFEQRESVTFSLVATDADNEEFIASQEFTINILDLNDVAPDFDPAEYSRQVKEDLSDLVEDEDGNLVLLTVTATDGDKSPEFGNDSLVYEISSSLPVSISSSGVIYVNATANKDFLDFESGVNPVLRVTVRDMQGNLQDSRFDTTSVTLEVTDVNDEQPTAAKSDQTLQTFCLYENDPEMWPEEACSGNPGDTHVLDLIITGTDRDSSADLTIAIDWEASQARKDRAIVDDEDLYVPCFVMLIESDDGGVITAKLSLTDQFIDREQVDSLTLVIAVTDVNTERNSDTTTVVIEINISDLNDSPPEFANLDSLQFEMNEHAEEDPFVGGVALYYRIQVTDLDSSEPHFTFTLEGDEESDGLLSIRADESNPSVAVLVVDQRIDFEALSSGSLSYDIIVTDDGGNVAREPIVIEVHDLNDCTPEFPEGTGTTATIPEDTANGTVVLTVTAVDRDLTPAFSKVYYELDNNIYPFAVDRNTGDISVLVTEATGELDYENLNQRSYTFTLRARDNEGGQSNLESISITIQLSDVNDNSPVFDSIDCPFHVSEETIANLGFATLEATDVDSSLNGYNVITYNIVSEEDIFPFQVDPDSGDISATQSIIGLNTTLLFSATATDGGGRVSDVLECQINIFDVNNNSPVFSFPVNGEPTWVEENSTAGALVTTEAVPVQLLATDADTFDLYNTVVYRLREGANDQEVLDYFSVQPDGQVMLLQDLITFPYESEDDNRIFVYVEASDSDPDTPRVTPITLELAATKNYQPVFEEGQNQLDMAFEEEDPGVSRRLFSAFDQNTDPDFGGFNETICYYIHDDNPDDDIDVESVFTLGLHDNTLGVSAPLDRENISSYSFVVFASNSCQGKPANESVSLESRLRISLTVTDINDHDPKFEDSPGIFGGIGIGDGQDNWERIIRATDADLNPVLTYSIVGDITVSEDSTGLEDLEDPTFEVATDANRGILTSRFTVSSGMKGHFLFDMRVTDGTRQSTIPVKIVIITESDRIRLFFDQELSVVEPHASDIKSVMDVNFRPWIFSVDGTSATASDGGTEGGTTMLCHFIDETYNPVAGQRAQRQYTVIEANVTLGLAEYELTLRRFDGGYTEEIIEDTDNKLATAFIIVSAVIAVMFGFLLIAYFIRVNNLERRVRALGATTFGSVDSGMNRVGALEAMPGTNMHAVQGANPIFNVEDDYNERKRQMMLNARGFADGDSDSVSSGDSVLIGVEDQAEFTNYKGHKNTIEADDLSDSGTNMSDDNFGQFTFTQGKTTKGGHDDDGDSIDLNAFSQSASGRGQNPLYDSDEDV